LLNENEALIGDSFVLPPEAMADVTGTCRTNRKPEARTNFA
jgi:hypothetical protein